MRKQQVNTLLSALALSGRVFSRAPMDPMRVPDPEGGGSSLCGITSDPTARGFLLDKDPGGGGGDDVRFDEKQQAKLNALLAEEKRKGQAAADELKRQLDAQKSQIEALTAESQKRAEEEAKRAEEIENKGKSALEIAQAQILKGADRIKQLEAEKAKAIAEEAAKTKAVIEQRDAFVKRTVALSALGSGVAEGALEDAVSAFMSNAQIELGEDLKLAKITYGGNVLEKPAEAGAAFLKDRPYYAAPPSGGNGHPRSPGGRLGPDLKSATSTELLSNGLREPHYGT